MTIKLLQAWNGYAAGSILNTGDLATEAALVAQFVATYDTTGGTVPPRDQFSATDLRAGPTGLTAAQIAAGATGVVAQTSGGSQIGPDGSPVSGGNLSRLPSIPSSKTGSVSAAVPGGATPWARLWGPNELRQTPWAGSAEMTTPSAALKYVTAASGSTGPAMYRREGASMWIDGATLLANTGAPTYGNMRTNSAALAAGQLASTVIAVLVYAHRLGASSAIRLRLGTSSADYIYYQWAAANYELIEGWNVLLVSTAEPIGSGNDSPGGQHDLQTGGGVKDGWRWGTGVQTFSFAQAINYAAVEVLGMTARTSLWVEGVYYGGRDKPRLTVGFDIQTGGLDVAKSVMDPLGIIGYAAVPTSNGVPANPQYLWDSVSVNRLQSIYAAGWDVIQHSLSHNSMGALTDDGALIAELEGCREQIISIGTPSGADLFATPNYSYSNRLIGLMARAGIKWGRHGGNAPILLPRGLVGLVNPLVQGCYGMMTTASGDAADVARFTQYINLLVLYGASGHCYTHAITASPVVGLETSTAAFSQMMAVVAAQVAAGNLEVVTPSSFIRDSAPPVVDSILAVPSRLPITPAASPYDLINVSYKTHRYQISGGAVSSITYSRDGITFDSTGTTGGQFDVQPGDRLRITYTAAPTIIQYSV